MERLHINFCERGPITEELDTTELEILDKVSPTSISEFIKLFAEDKSFAPPESSMVFDSDLGDISIDDDESPEMSYDFEEAKEDENNTRARD